MATTNTTATTKTAAKKAPPPKAKGKKAAAKKKTAKKAAKKAVAKKAPTKLEADKISTEDVQSKVEKINKLIADTEQSRTKNDWKVGQALCWIRERVTDGTWGKVCTDWIQGLGGRILGKSSVDKKMKLYNTFPKDEAKAVAIGVGRLDQICRLPSAKEREDVLSGVKIKGEVVEIADMKVRDLAAYIDKYMEKAHPKKVKPPQQQFVSALTGLAKKANKLLEDHAKTLKTRTFEKEDIEAATAAVKSLKDFLAGLTIKKAADKTDEAKAA